MKIRKAAVLVVIFVFSLTGLAAQTAAQPAKGRHIVVFKPGVADPEAAAHGLANAHNGRVGHVYRHALKGFVFYGAAEAANALARRQQVDYVETDQVYHAWGQVLPTGVNRADTDVAVSIDGIDDAIDADIAIIDTGLDQDHPDLNIVGGVRFYNDGPYIVKQDNNWNDDNGHGTHVGGSAAAKDNGIGVVGVAPGARLTAVKVLDSSGSGYTSGVVAGIDWVVSKAATFEVANLSLGGGYSQSMNDAVKRGTDAGIVFVVAAGNSADDATKYSPASEPSAITVSAMTDSDGLPGGTGQATSYGSDDAFASFSNYGKAVDVCAPGVSILSTWHDGNYVYASGTSMASPHVAGAAALYLSKYPSAGVQAVADAIRNSGWKAGDPEYFTGDSDGIAEPLLNVATLVGAGGGSVDDPPAVLVASPSAGSTVSGTVTVEAAANDDYGVTQVEFFIGGISLGTDTDLSDGWTALWDTTSLADGGYTVKAVATDSSGQTAGHSHSVTVGNHTASAVQVASITYSAYGGKHNDKHLVTTVALEDNVGNPVAGASVTVRIDNSTNGQSWSGSATTGSSGTVAFELKNAPKGHYETVVTAVSASGLNWDGTTPSNELYK